MGGHVLLFDGGYMGNPDKIITKNSLFEADRFPGNCIYQHRFALGTKNIDNIVMHKEWAL